MQRLQIMLNHFDSGRSRDQNVQVGYSGGYLCTKPRSPATALKTKEYIGVIDLYGGCDWGAVFHAPRVILTLPHRHPRGVAFDARLVTILFDPMHQARLIGVKEEQPLPDFDEGLVAARTGTAFRFPRHPCEYSPRRVQIEGYRRKTLFQMTLVGKSRLRERDLLERQIVPSQMPGTPVRLYCFLKQRAVRGVNPVMSVGNLRAN